jgi:Tol biopolymer transport system component/DNA-binding winged helix-turn-helix (wHTH) protein
VAGLTSSRQILRFGDFEIDLRVGELRKCGLKIHLQEHSYQVLVALLECPRELVTRETLRARLWSADTFVDFDHGLNTAINRLREALVDSPSHPRYIETVPRRGYRFIAPVQSLATDPAPPLADPVPDQRRKHLSWRWIALLLAAAIVTGWAFRYASHDKERTLSALPITTNLGSEAYPSFAPQGDRVAFSWDGPDRTNFDIYVQLLGPGKLSRLTTNPAGECCPAWSPDGRQIAFIREMDEPKWGVFVMFSFGGGERKVAEFWAAGDFQMVAEGFPYTLASPYLAWSPDSKWLILPNKESPSAPVSLAAVAVAGPERHQLTKPPANFLGDSGPAMSSDGRRLVFSRARTRFRSAICQVDLTPDLQPGHDTKRLTPENEHSVSPTWALDGNSIVYSSSRGSTGHSLWRKSMGGPARPLVLGSTGEFRLHPDVSRHGFSLVYANASFRGEIWEAALRAGARGPLKRIASTQSDLSPDISPDGRHIAFFSERSGAMEIWTCERDGSSPEPLTDLRAHSVHPRWSPDGRHIAFQSDFEGQFDIYTVDIEGGGRKRLTTGEVTDRAPNWSRDGKWIYFGSNQTGAYEIWKVASEGGEPVQVTKHGGFAGCESPDGRYLYYVKAIWPSGIWRTRLDGGEEELVLDRITDGLNFSPGKDGLYYSRDGFSIEFQPWSGGERRLLVSRSTLANGRVLGLTVSLDGKALLYGRVSPESDLMLVENFH